MNIILTTPEELRAIVSETVSQSLAGFTQPKNEPDNLTPDVAVEVLERHGFLISKARLYKLTAKKEVPFRKYGNKLLFSRKELLTWAENLAKRWMTRTGRHSPSPRAQTVKSRGMEDKRKVEARQDTPMQKEDFAALWKTIHLKVTDTYEVPPEMLWVNGSTIGTLGNFSASTGKAKSKKTFNISAIVAAALKNDEVLKYSAYLPPNKRKILYVDTEQSKYHCHKVMERILRLAGLPTDKDRDDFVFIVLREQTPDKRKQIIGYMLENMPDVGLLIIDGIRDLMYDINSPSESTDLINLLMRWSSGYNLHIHTVLHLNKGDDNTRGHIGTELNNKAETVLQITKSQQDGNISEVKAMHIRDREFDPFAFRINDNALPEIVDDYVFQQPKQDRNFPLTELTEQQHREALENGFGKQVVQGYSNVIAALKQGYASIGYERGRNVLVSLNKFLVNKRMIVKEGKGYRYNPDFHY